MSDTAIEWSDKVWNPVTGCTKVSAGCKNCYAEGVANRFWGDRKFTDVQCHEDRLEAPLHWKKPRRIFVNSMSDLFHEDVPDSFIDRVMAVISLTPQHTYQVLTKRPKRMYEYFTCDDGFGPWGRVEHQARKMFDLPQSRTLSVYGESNLPHLWLGVSVEDQETANERIPLLLKTPSAVRWISAEPLLGEIDLIHLNGYPFDYRYMEANCVDALRCEHPAKLDWVVVGGESGPHARPMALGWAKDIVMQCQQVGVPVFVKQMGAKPTNREGEPCPHIKHKKGADVTEWPLVLQVREFPA